MTRWMCPSTSSLPIKPSSTTSSSINHVLGPPNTKQYSNSPIPAKWVQTLYYKAIKFHRSFQVLCWKDLCWDASKSRQWSGLIYFNLIISDIATMWDMAAMCLSPGDLALKIGVDLKQFLWVNQVVGSQDLTPTSISSIWWVQSDYF